MTLSIKSDGQFRKPAQIILLGGPTEIPVHGCKYGHTYISKLEYRDSFFIDKNILNRFR